ncbi:Integrase catalytic region [Novosphingobium resinovorum]|uniref:Integrase catalytic region n=1 Tax=Novosphingobium resinovorum TaxID=158500 RepID=A0A031JPC7_9SPHN|nr:Integrase catalytic region [Novosphingobium resinovorum]
MAVGSTGGGNTLIFCGRWSVAMKQRRRIYYTASQRAEIWDRWQRGESMSSIGRRFDRESSSVFSVISPTGGIRPADRKRSIRALSLAEREEISRGLSVSEPLRAIERRLGRSPSTISREVRRNGGPARYCATASDQAAWDRALRPKPCKLACSPPTGPGSIGQAAPQMVTGTDRGVAQAQLSRGAAQAGVARDHLQKPVHTGARSSEEGTAGASARPAHDPQVPARQPQA